MSEHLEPLSETSEALAGCLSFADPGVAKAFAGRGERARGIVPDVENVAARGGAPPVVARVVISARSGDLP